MYYHAKNFLETTAIQIKLILHLSEERISIEALNWP